MEPSFFDHVLHAVEGFVADVPGVMHATAHRRGMKVWFDDSKREHYETQLLRIDGESVLEVGFHAEHPKPEVNDAVIAALAAAQRRWKQTLGGGPVVGEFIGGGNWRRVSEVWPAPDEDDIDAAIEVAARLADYIHAIEPLRR